MQTRRMNMDCASVRENITAWLRFQVAQAAAKGLVVGMSGGVDSALTAVLCKEACPESTLGLVLPAGSNPKDAEDALLVARQYDIAVRVIDLSGVFELLMGELTAWGARERTSLAIANLKPRLRMICLYYLANEYNYLVAGTANAVELALGYFTKYGDGGVDLLPLGNLTKKAVYELGRYIGLPERILTKAPTAGLLPGQTDEGDLGFTYEEIEAVLCGTGGSKEAREFVHRRRALNRHKLASPPTAPADPCQVLVL